MMIAIPLVGSAMMGMMDNRTSTRSGRTTWAGTTGITGNTTNRGYATTPPERGARRARGPANGWCDYTSKDIYYY